MKKILYSIGLGALLSVGIGKALSENEYYETVMNQAMNEGVQEALDFALYRLDDGRQWINYPGAGPFITEENYDKRIKELEDYKKHPEKIIYTIDSSHLLNPSFGSFGQAIGDTNEAITHEGLRYALLDDNYFLKKLVAAGFRKILDGLKDKEDISAFSNWYNTKRSAVINTALSQKIHAGVSSFITPKLQEADQAIKLAIQQIVSSNTLSQEEKENKILPLLKRQTQIQTYLSDPIKLIKNFDIKTSTGVTPSQAENFYTNKINQRGLWHVIEDDVYLNLIVNSIVSDAIAMIEERYSLTDKQTEIIWHNLITNPMVVEKPLEPLFNPLEQRHVPSWSHFKNWLGNQWQAIKQYPAQFGQAWKHSTRNAMTPAHEYQLQRYQLGNEEPRPLQRDYGIMSDLKAQMQPRMQQMYQRWEPTLDRMQQRVDDMKPQFGQGNDFDAYIKAREYYGLDQ